MKTSIQRWGNSLAVRLPKAFAENIGLMDNSPVEITIDNGQLVITPLREPTYSLDALLAGITDENMHSETDTGAPTGNESW
jgi:antitoxin MazE